MTGAFLRVACPSCEHEQIVFDRAATEIACGDCGEILAQPTGGAATLRGEVLEAVEQR